MFFTTTKKAYFYLFGEPFVSERENVFSQIQEIFYRSR